MPTDSSATGAKAKASATPSDATPADARPADATPADATRADASRANPIRLAVLVSGGGTTLQNLMDRIASSELHATIAVVVASNAGAHEKVSARNLDVPVHLAPRKQFNTAQEFSDVVFDHVRHANADLVCLAGFLSLLTIPDDYVRKVINVHPALLPAFGGAGMYGRRVHEAVLAAGCKVSGCTVHFADQTYDTGPILVQRTCPVLDDDTAQTLAERVFEQECLAYPEAIHLIAEGRVIVTGRRTSILPGQPLASEAGEQLVRRAAELCVEAHAGQTRAGGQPYSTHPIAVADILRRRGVQDPAVLAAAYLHDVIEDTGVALDDLRDQFGSRVADLVSQVTNPDRPDRSFAQKHRELAEHARRMTDGAKLIKLADRLHNLRGLHARPPEKQTRYARVTLNLLDALVPWPPAGDAVAEAIRTLVAQQLEDEPPEHPVATSH